MLVAGCGTSQAVRYALRWPRARVVGIDVSAASLRITRTLADRHGLDRLELRELPVERASELGERFDHVVCTGVIHHLPDPGKGLRALRDVLVPRGAMHLMVYAPYGRAGVYLIQAYARRLGIGTSRQEIRDLASTLRALPEGRHASSTRPWSCCAARCRGTAPSCTATTIRATPSRSPSRVGLGRDSCRSGCPRRCA